jgi:hypothetical protein
MPRYELHTLLVSPAIRPNFIAEIKKVLSVSNPLIKLCSKHGIVKLSCLDGCGKGNNCCSNYSKDIKLLFIFAYPNNKDPGMHIANSP